MPNSSLNIIIYFALNGLQSSLEWVYRTEKCQVVGKLKSTTYASIIFLKYLFNSPTYCSQILFPQTSPYTSIMQAY